MLLGAEPSELGADDLEELADDEDEYFRLGAVDEHFRDYAALALKGDHGNRPAMLNANPKTLTLISDCCKCACSCAAVAQGCQGTRRMRLPRMRQAHYRLHTQKLCGTLSYSPALWHMQDAIMQDGMAGWHMLTLGFFHFALLGAL